MLTGNHRPGGEGVIAPARAGPVQISATPRMSALSLAVRFGLVMHGFQGGLIGFGLRLVFRAFSGLTRIPRNVGETQTA